MKEKFVLNFLPVLCTILLLLLLPGCLNPIGDEDDIAEPDSIDDFDDTAVNDECCSGDLGIPDDYSDTIEYDLYSYKSVQLPSNFSWLDQGVVTPARDVGDCWSSWVFAAVGAFEARRLKKALPFDMLHYPNYVLPFGKRVKS